MSSVNDSDTEAPSGADLEEAMLPAPPARPRTCTPQRYLYILLAAFSAAIGVGVLSAFIVPRPSFPPATVAPFYTYPCPPCAANGCVNVSRLYTVKVCPSGPAACAANASLFQPACVYDNSIDHRMEDALNMVPGQSVAWAGFAFTSPVVVEVDTSFDFTSCIVRPRSKGVACEMTSTRSVSMTLTSPMLKLSIELYAASVGNDASYMMHPLLLFADPPEDPSTVPSSEDPTALIFGPGLHVLATQMPLHGDVTQIYIAPGAYVIGGFITASNAAVRITGRGVLSGETFPWHSPDVLWGLININDGSGHLVDGITIIDSPMFYIASVAHNAVIRNVKCAVAWPYNSDGMDVGNGALIEDVFIRSNDDSVKISGSNSVAQRITVWQMINGAVVQLGWVNLVRQNVLVQDIDVIHVDYCAFDGGKYCAASDNEAIIDAAPDGVTVATTSGITIQNIRVEGDAVRMLYLALPSTATGSISGVSIVNVTADSQSLARGEDYGLIAGGSSTNAMITDVAVQGLVIGGTCAANAAAAGVEVDAATTANIVFEC